MKKKPMPVKKSPIVIKKPAKKLPAKKLPYKPVANYKEHKAKWVDCDKCGLCTNRSKVIFARGSLPCDVLFIGEAPGVSEDTIGTPMIGPAGKLLDYVISTSQNNVKAAGGIKFAITNLVSCIPLQDNGAKSSEPPKESIEACLPKLYEFIRIAKPRAIVFVGKLAEEWVDPAKIKLRVEEPHDHENYVSIAHPAMILRADISSKDLLIQRCVTTVTDLFEELLVPF